MDRIKFDLQLFAQSTYSFQDLSGTISHPSVGVYTLTSSGIGEMTLSQSNDASSMDTGADGSVMISKIATPSGTISIQVQQTSDLNNWLMKWYQYLQIAGSDEWASANILIRAPKMGRSHVATGVCPQKQADTPYQAQGQRITWTLMCADLKYIPI